MNEFGSSDDSSKGSKTYMDLTIMKGIGPLSLKIDEPLNFFSHREFDMWLEVGLKKKNKYVSFFKI